MATGKTSGGDAAATATAETKSEKRTLPEGFKANEPTHKSGLDADGKPDGTLSVKQVVRAGTEAMLALRPQPSKEHIELVIGQLQETDENGQPKVKVKTAKEAGEKAVSLLP